MRTGSSTGPLLLTIILASSALGCGRSKPPGDGAPAASGSASAAAPAASASAPAADAGKPPQPAAKGIQVAIKDFQLFHPYSPERSMPSAKDNGSYSTRESSSSYGLGVIVEATNDTGEVLHGAWFEGTLRFSNAEREIECHYSPDNVGEPLDSTFTLHYNDVPPDTKKGPRPGEKPTHWRNESRSLAESVWRPGERIRFQSRNNACDSLVLADMPPSQIKGQLVVKASKRFVRPATSKFDSSEFDLALVGDSLRIVDKASKHVVVLPVKDNVFEMLAAGDAAPGASVVPLSHLELRNSIRFSRRDVVESAPVTFELPPQAMTLEMVKLPSGEMVHASGNVLIYVKDDKVVRQDMAKQGLSLLDVPKEPVPAATPPVSFAKNELTGKVKGIVLADHVEDTSLAKGQRKLGVTFALHLQGDGIDGRLRAPFDVAASELDQATADLEKVPSDDRAAVAKAKAAEAKAKAAKSAAETKYKTGLKGEREKLAKAFPCGDVKLATNRGTRGPSNGKTAADACKALAQDDDVEVTVTYVLDRHEVPVALAYSLGGAFTWNPIASAPLLKMNPR